MAAKIGFYICHCGINISHKVLIEEVVSFARELQNVAIAREYKFMCSDPGQEMIEKDIREFALNRVVVASCSPRLHEKTFQGACQRAGLNPYFFQMASVREQVSWVTDGEDEATRKAKTLVAGAVNRVNYHQSLDAREVSVHPDVLVVGGGIAGMQAALDIGNGGHKVYLVEKSTTIGGHMLQFDKTFPTLDCAACIGTPKMVEVAQNSNIELLSYSEVEEISGFIGNYRVKIHRKPRFIKEGVCTGCGECITVCPVSVPCEWDEELGDRKAIYRSFPQAVPITFCIDKRDRAPCVTACPAGTNVHGYVQMVKVGNYQQALNIIMERLPLPGVLGRVCPHPCENECRRSLIDSPISIRELKRFAADNARLEDVPLPEVEQRNEKIAVIGSGPAGLTVAYYLRLKGFKVTIFEALEKPGGMLRSGIPDFRLPPEILDQEIEHILSTGIELIPGMALGMDFTLAGLKEQGYDAIFLGIGAHLPIKMNIENEDIAGVVDAIPFLRQVNLEGTKEAEPRVVVIGGGNVAMDAARAAIRSGAEKVTIIYRRTEHEMPAYKEEIEGARAEGIEFMTLASPFKVVQESGRVVGIECIKNKLGPADESGRRRPVPVEGSEFVVECNMVIPAIGQRVDTGTIVSEKNIDLTAWGSFKVDHRTMQTSEAGIFSAGDAVTGPSTVIEAVAAGHKVVKAIERYLNKEMEIYDDGLETGKSQLEKEYLPVPEDALRVERAEPRVLDVKIRENSFKEVDLGFLEIDARREAQRCINCGGCCECMECVRVCEPNAIEHNMNTEELEVEVGSIILATGFDVLDPTPMKQYGYGQYPNVYTSLEFERLNNATGPTGGKILIRDENGEFTRTPGRVAILHCVGSRDVNYHEYCSRVCCMYALKYSHLIHEKVGHDTKIYNFYIDMRCFGKGYEEFYQRCQNEGTRFVRGKVAEITDRALVPDEEGMLVAIAEDTLLGQRLRVPVDMVILCTAMQARTDAQEVGRVFGVNQGADGFFLEEHPKLGPLNTATDGVFLAGTCQGPKDIPDTVSQASGAAVKALALATLGEVEIAPIVSWIDPEVCAGCKTCIDLCPYNAIEYDARREISEVNEALCKGCGSCSGFCPSGAAQVRHFNEKQVFAELEGIMDSLSIVGM